MWKAKLSLIGIYVIIIVAVLSIAIGIRLNAFARTLSVNAFDLIRPLPSSVLSDTQVTILLLGISGEGHDGPYLTDSITILRYSPSHHTIRTLGIPRDLWVPEIKDKINSIYTYALQQKIYSPYTYTKEKFHNILGTQIDYVVIINFSDFEELIDLIGGIKVHLDKGFVDPLFPIDGAENKDCIPYDPNFGCRYQTLMFRAGDLKLNGAVALKFVRSRHAEGDEGSDFSRSKRQQIVVTAIKNRLFELMRERDFDKLLSVISFLNTHIKRDISNQDSLHLVRTGIQQSPLMESATLTEDMLEMPPMDEYEGRYVLIPPMKDYKRLQTTIEDLLNRGQKK